MFHRGLPDLSSLRSIAHRRGFRPLPVIGIVLAASVPVAVLTALREPGYASAMLVSICFVLLPTVALLVWSIVDREGRSAREIVLWLDATARTSANASQPAVRAVAEQLIINWTNRSSLTELASHMTDAMLPLVQDRRSAKLKIVLYRFWYVVVWVIIAVALAALFLVAISISPECGALQDPGPLSMCH